MQTVADSLLDHNHRMAQQSVLSSIFTQLRPTVCFMESEQSIGWLNPTKDSSYPLEFYVLKLHFFQAQIYFSTDFIHLSIENLRKSVYFIHFVENLQEEVRYFGSSY